MQRETDNRAKESSKMAKLRFQQNFNTQKINFEAAKAALPFFGGSEDEAPESPSPSDKESVTPAQDSLVEAPLGGDSGKTAELAPEQIADLLKQVSESNKKLTEATSKLSEYENKEKSAARAQQTREEVLEQDLVEAQQTIQRMDAVIRQTALINAIQGAKDIEFHSARHVLRELDPNAVEMDVDLENGTATVSGIDAELKRIARECDWLVKNNSVVTQETKARAPRGSGTPPAPPNGSNDKSTRRQDLINRYPVISHGRAR